MEFLVSRQIVIGVLESWAHHRRLLQRILHVIGGILVFDRRSLVGLGNRVRGVDGLAVRGAILLVQKRRSGKFSGKAICVEGILLGLRVRPGHWELVCEGWVTKMESRRCQDHAIRLDLLAVGCFNTQRWRIQSWLKNQPTLFSATWREHWQTIFDVSEYPNNHAVKPTIVLYLQSILNITFEECDIVGRLAKLNGK